MAQPLADLSLDKYPPLPVPRPVGMSENEAFILSRPSVTLFVNRSEESERAFRALEVAAIHFCVVPAPRRRAPMAEWGPWQFKGLAGVEELVEMLQNFDRVALEETERQFPGLLGSGDPHRADWLEQVIRRHTDEGRAILDDLRSGRKPAPHRRVDKTAVPAAEHWRTCPRA